MTRVVKSPDVRRLEIMEVAKSLFEQQGYAKTSVEAIITKADIAKGTFYYYFKAKPDILEALVEQTCDEFEAVLQTIVDNKALTALQKLKMMIRGPQKQALVNAPVMKIIHKPENRELQELLNIQTVERIAPLFEQVFKQGYEEGIFKQSVSLETIQLVLAGSAFVLDSNLFAWPKKKNAAFLQALQALLEQMTGVKNGTLGFVSNL